MKKLVAVMLMLTLTMGLTACGGEKVSDTTKDDTEGKTAVDIFTDVWAVYGEDEKFAISGGDYENMVSDAPGTVDVSNAEALNVLLGFPTESAELVDDGASMMHMMNQNSFTASIYHVTDAENVQTLADALKETIMDRQWMCGFPDDLVIYSVGEEYVAAAFGLEENIDSFQSHLEETYASSVLLYDEDLTF